MAPQRRRRVLTSRAVRPARQAVLPKGWNASAVMTALAPGGTVVIAILDEPLDTIVVAR